jgi:hypothetical protein
VSVVTEAELQAQLGPFDSIQAIGPQSGSGEHIRLRQRRGRSKPGADPNPGQITFGLPLFWQRTRAMRRSVRA